LLGLAWKPALQAEEAKVRREVSVGKKKKKAVDPFGRKTRCRRKEYVRNPGRGGVTKGLNEKGEDVKPCPARATPHTWVIRIVYGKR